MSGRRPSSLASPVVLALQRRVKDKGLTGYGLTKATKLPLRTVQRFLAGKGSPTLSTIEAIASALGVTIQIGD
jgi:transcriptional regulator with XRE-family HTH domain